VHKLLSTMRLVAWLLCIGLVAYLAWYSRGSITLFWGEYAVEISSALLLVLFMVVTILLLWGYRLATWLVHKPKQLASMWDNYRENQYLRTLSVAIMAYIERDFRHLENALEQAPKQVQAPMLLETWLRAELAAQQGETLAATSLYQQLLESQELAAGGYIGLITLAHRAHDKQLVLDYLKRALVNAGHSLPLLELALKCFAEHRCPKEYCKVVDRMVERGFLVAEVARQYQAEMWYQEATQGLERADVKYAERSLKTALSMQPNHLQAALLQAELQKHAGNVRAAWKSIQHGWEHHPAVEWLRLTEQIYAHEPFSKRYQHLMTLLAQHPTDASWHVEVAKICRCYGEWEKVIEHATLAEVRQGGPEAPLLRAEAMLQLGKPYAAILEQLPRDW
jgi:uncharacterized membrane-anchored protein